MFCVRGILTPLLRPISLDTKVQFELGISQIKAGSMGYKFISINFPVDPLFIFILLILYHPSTLTWNIAPHKNTDYILFMTGPVPVSMQTSTFHVNFDFNNMLLIPRVPPGKIILILF